MRREDKNDRLIMGQSAIFFAKSTTGMPGSWTNEGLVTSTSTSNNYNVRVLKSLRVEESY